jgi:hypothetical protein
MSIVETPPDPLIIAVNNRDHAAGRNAQDRLLNHLLKNPRMGRTPRNFQANGREILGHGWLEMRR